jgi:uncharacterized protein (TIGR03790 family)
VALAIALVSGLASCGGGGGGGGGLAPGVPASTLSASGLAVLIAQGDATSEAIGLAYQQARGIPEANMIRVAVPAGSDSLSSADFMAVKTAIDARLPASVQATLVTWSRPSRVVGACAMGITSALALGWDAAYCGLCTSTRPSPYFDSDSRAPWTELRLRPSMMLGATTLAEAQSLIARGLAADGSLAAGGQAAQGRFVRTSDISRNPRWPDLQAAAATAVPGVSTRYLDNQSGTGSDLVSGQADLMFYFTGLGVVGQLATNGWWPGGIGDNLTSFAAVLPDANGQTSVLDWLRSGATGSYGTVEEPCNFAQKFAQATVLLKHYKRGETLIEAYWKSVQMPGQGLFVGEPLARPWTP